jgi:hypothetical protein
MTNAAIRKVEPGGYRLGKLWLILAVGLVALGETAAHFVFRNRAPSPQDWQALKSQLTPLHQSGDLVAVAPAWGEPLARLALGDAMMPLSMVARADDADFPRALQISFFGHKREELSRWPEVRRDKLGPFTISILNNPNWHAARYQFIDHVESTSLSVSVAHNGIDEVCPFSDSAPMSAGNLGGDPTSPRVRFNCPGGSFHWVGVTIIDDERYGPRRCIWAPPNSVGPIVLRFRQVPLGKKLIGHAGAPWLMVRDGVGPPISLSVAGSRGILGSIAAKDTDGWIRFEWDTRNLENTTSDLQLAVVGTAHLEQRFCFTLESQ